MSPLELERAADLFVVFLAFFLFHLLLLYSDIRSLHGGESHLVFLVLFLFLVFFFFLEIGGRLLRRHG